MSDDLYFEPPSRLQLVDKLAHLLRFSNAFVVLSGPEGAGTTTVVSRLTTQLNGDGDYLLSLSLNSNTGLGQLLILLNEQIDQYGSFSDSASNDQLTNLHHKIEYLAQSQRKIIIFLDNADFVNDEALECLVNLQVASTNNVAVLTAGLEKLPSRLSQLTNNGSQLANYHLETLPPFNRLETEEYIHQFFVRGTDFSKKQLSDIFNKSLGYPGRISQLTTEMIKVGKIGLGAKKGILPLPHLISIGVLVFAIVTALTWQIFTNGPDDQEIIAADSEDGSTISQELALDLQDNNVFDDGGLQNDTNVLDQKIAELSAQIEGHKDTQQNLTLEAERLLEQQAIASDASNELDLNENSQGLVDIDNLPPTVNAESDLETLALSERLKEELILTEANSASVTDKLEQLTSSLKGTINESSLTSIVDQPVTVEVVAEPSKQKEVNVDIVSSGIASSRILASVDAIKRWPNNGYTLQLLAAGSEESVVKFLATAPEAEKMYMYKTVLNNKPWNVIVFGQYNSRANATFAISKLPNELRQLQPWVKTISSVKTAIK